MLRHREGRKFLSTTDGGNSRRGDWPIAEPSQRSSLRTSPSSVTDRVHWSHRGTGEQMEMRGQRGKGKGEQEHSVTNWFSTCFRGRSPTTEPTQDPSLWSTLSSVTDRSH